MHEKVKKAHDVTVIGYVFLTKPTWTVFWLPLFNIFFEGNSTC